MEDDGKGRCSPVPSTSSAALDIQHLSEFRARSSGNGTDSMDRKDWIRRYIMNYRSDISPEQLENLWSQVTEMVGFFSEPVPSGGGGGGGGGDNNADVRRVVCSPDLPLPAASGVPDGGGTGPVAANDHRCLVCNKHFASRGALLTHQRTHAPPPPQQHQQAQQKGGATADPYQCNVCNKTFAVPARLSRHYRTHTGERPFQCDFCDKKFGVKENLSVHRRIHTKERPYKCEVCARAFEHSGKLHRHMRIHTGERPHRCTVCGKTFIQSGQLVIHTRTHTGEKPYVCNVCRKGFTCSKQLKVHSRTHTGEKPYACDICGKAFGYNHVLKLHQVAHYGEKVYKCTLCHDTFTSKKTMEAHIKSHSEGAISPVSQPVASQPEPSTSLPPSDIKNVIAKEEYLPATSAQHQPHIQQTSESYKHSESYYSYPKSERTSEYSIQQIDYVPQQMSGVDPVLLAAAAVAANEDKSAVRIIQQKQPMAESSPSYIAFAPSSEPSSYYPPLDRCDNIRDIRRRVEAALATTEDEQDPLYITPPSSAPVSPAPSSSPEPAELILPMRKRSKAILQSMEREDSPVVSSPVVRYSSVIQYARAS